jgi:hypothetical protein
MVVCLLNKETGRCSYHVTNMTAAFGLFCYFEASKARVQDEWQPLGLLHFLHCCEEEERAVRLIQVSNYKMFDEIICINFLPQSVTAQ